MMGRLGSLLAEAVGQIAASLARLTVVSLFVITFLAQPSQIPSSSMEPTMLVGDFVLVNKQVFAPAGHFRWLLPYREPVRDDIVVFHYPVNPPELLVKRIIAMPGDRIHLHQGHPILNNAPLLEPFTHYANVDGSAYRDEFPNLQRADPGAQATWWIELRNRMRSGELPVPPNRYFVLGDNRNNSSDSRFWGFVPHNAIVGEPLLIYLSSDETAPRSERIRWTRFGHVVR